jgi:hypothetical protein
MGRSTDKFPYQSKNRLQTYGEIAELAAIHADYSKIVNVSNQRFLTPKSISQAVKDHLFISGLPDHLVWENCITAFFIPWLLNMPKRSNN